MVIPDRLRQNVFFLYADVKGERRPAGTAFVVGYSIDEESSGRTGVLLTAQHVLDDVEVFG